MPSPPRNSLLNLLNPYASVTQSTAQTRPDEGGDESPTRGSGRDSPSTMLLRELTSGRPRSPPTSPTPTPQRPFADSSSEDEGPPRSLMFQVQERAELTPTSRTPVPQPPGPTRINTATRNPASSSRAGSSLHTPAPERQRKKGKVKPSPGPFRRRLSSSSSTSTSRHSSPERQVRQSINVPHAGDASVQSSTEPPTPSSTSDEVGMEATAPVAGPSAQATQPEGYAVESPTPKRTKGRGRHKYHALEMEDGPTVREASKGLSGRNKALWQWVNVVDLDKFLQDVYWYYKGKGLQCIILARSLALLTNLFVVAFSTFLISCIDYSKLTHSAEGNSIGRLGDVLIKQCIVRGGVAHWLFMVSVTAFFVFQLVTFVTALPKLFNLYQFYTHLIGVPDSDIQTLPWPEIVRRIAEIKNENPITSLSNGQATALEEMVGKTGPNAKLDAHDIANRILRQENYLIALFNKDLLDLRVRIPVYKALQRWLPPRLLAGPPHTGLPRTADGEPQYLSFGGNVLTQALEWNLRWCLMGFLFDSNGQVRREVVRDKSRNLVTQLQTRFVFAGLLNTVFAPFIVVYLLLYSFFRYFEEYHKNPSSMGGRQYTPYAQWKFREFNELPHLFERRLNQSYPIAKEYIEQFPNERTSLIMRFVAFVSGSFAAVLFIASLLDPDLFLHFEVTPHRTVLFYIGLFGSIMAVARGMIPEENMVFDPEYLMREVVRYTHYLPSEWEGQLHSQQVHVQFGQLFALKIIVFLQELISVLLTPFILWFSLSPCSGAIIDFFREFTVHVDGVGYVCSFAVFDFHRPGNLGPEGAAAAAPAEPQAAARLRRRVAAVAPPRAMNNDHKMEKSFLHFKATHPDWTPQDPSSSLFLDRLMAHGGQSSTYHGGRGLGLVHPDRKHQDSPGRMGRGDITRSPELPRFHQLAPMEEEDDGEAEAMGWHRRVEDEDEGESGHRDRGMLRGAGDILQQVMNR